MKYKIDSFIIYLIYNNLEPLLTKSLFKKVQYTKK